MEMIGWSSYMMKIFLVGPRWVPLQRIKCPKTVIVGTQLSWYTIFRIKLFVVIRYFFPQLQIEPAKKKQKRSLQLLGPSTTYRNQSSKSSQLSISEVQNIFYKKQKITKRVSFQYPKSFLTSRGC